MDLKKRLLILLSAFSCLPISNAAENKPNTVQGKKKSDTTTVTHDKDNVRVVQSNATTA